METLSRKVHLGISSFQITPKSVYSRQWDEEVKSLSEAPEHDEGFGRKGPSGDGAVRPLVASRRTLAAEAAARELATGPSVAAHARHAAALPPVELTAVACGCKTPQLIRMGLPVHVERRNYMYTRLMVWLKILKIHVVNKIISFSQSPLREDLYYSPKGCAVPLESLLLLLMEATSHEVLEIPSAPVYEARTSCPSTAYQKCCRTGSPFCQAVNWIYPTLRM